MAPGSTRDNRIYGLITYASVAIVFCALTGLGTLPAHVLERAQPLPRLLRLPLLAVTGWGLASLLSAFGAIVNLNQIWLAHAMLVLGLLLLIPVFGRREWKRQLSLLGDLLLLVIFVAPMGLLVAATPATQFDEFSHWLPNTRYLVEHGYYWNWPDWLGLSSRPGYPNASAVVALLANGLTGPDVEAPFKIFVVMLLGTYGAVLASLAVTRWRAGGLITIALFASGCWLTFVDPFMDPRIGFSADTDTPSAILLAVALLAVSYGITAAKRGDHRVAGGWFAWTGFMSLTLVLLRPPNLVLVASMDGGTVLLLLILRAGNFRLWFRWVLWLLIPPVSGGLVWQIHLWIAGIGPITPRPLAQWDWSAPLTAIRTFVFDRLAGHPLMGGAALLLTVFGIIGSVAAWRRLGADEGDELPSPRVTVALAAIVSLCFVAFLAWAFMAMLETAEIVKASSLWRYLSELGLMVIAAAWGVALRLMPPPRLGNSIALAGIGLGLTMLVLLPYFGRGYYRLDCRFPDVAAARAAVAELRPVLVPFTTALTDPARVAVVNPTMGDWMAYAVDFDMRWPASPQLVRFRTADEPLAATEAWAWDHGLDALLDFRALDRAALRAQSAIPAVSLLGRPAAKGDPWPVLGTAQARPLPACAAWGH